MSSTWVTALDEYERRLDAIAEVLDQRSVAGVADFCPASGLGPLPLELADRAHELLERSRQLERVAAGLVAQAEIPAVPRHPRRPVAFTGHRIDFSA